MKTPFHRQISSLAFLLAACPTLSFGQPQTYTPEQAALIHADSTIAIEEAAVKIEAHASLDGQPNPEFGKPQKRFLEKHREFLERTQKPIDVLFLGDSITEGWLIKGRKVWDARFASRYRVANFGISGDRIQHVIWRIENGELAGPAPKAVVLLIGTNNAAHNTPEQIASGVRKIVELIHEKAADTRVIVINELPRSFQPTDPQGRPDPRRQTVAKVNELLPKFADGRRTVYLPLWAPFLNADGTMKKELMPDALHPNEAGYEIIADALAPLLPEPSDAAPDPVLPKSLTPPPPPVPRINGPTVFGVRPGSPFLYRIPATGQKPITFSVENLPAGLAIDSATGQITGHLDRAGSYPIVLRATNSLGSDQKTFRISVGEQISLTPAMGWNSWNCWAAAVDQEKVLRSARALVASGLADFGWTYVNIDDTWQGARTGTDHALQANDKFPDMKRLCGEIHRLGLKAGIYSTPWVTSYAKYAGGASDRADGFWSQELASPVGHRHGAFSFARADARQWAAWGFDYLKYDWKPNDVPHTQEMSEALRASGRDIVYSISNTAPYEHAADWARLTNSWRTTGDIWDRWAHTEANWQFGVSEIGFAQHRWRSFGGPGHWNDPDMLVVGKVGWGPKLHQTELTPDEQYTHISLWCLLSAPLLIGCDLDQLDPFTIGLLTNREVLALDQDALGRPAAHIASLGAVDIYLKDLEDGSKAIGFFNRDSQPQSVHFNKLGYFGFEQTLKIRDLWRQVDLPDIADPRKQSFDTTIPAHGVMLFKLSAGEGGLR